MSRTTKGLSQGSNFYLATSWTHDLKGRKEIWKLGIVMGFGLLCFFSFPLSAVAWPWGQEEICTDLHLIAEEFRRVCRSPHPARASLGTEHLLLTPLWRERNLSDFEEIPACFSVILLGREQHESYLQLCMLAPYWGKLPFINAVSDFFWGMM